MNKYYIVVISDIITGIELPYHFTKESLARLFINELSKDITWNAVFYLSEDVFQSTEKEVLDLIRSLQNSM